MGHEVPDIAFSSRGRAARLRFALESASWRIAGQQDGVLADYGAAGEAVRQALGLEPAPAAPTTIEFYAADRSGYVANSTSPGLWFYTILGADGASGVGHALTEAIAAAIAALDRLAGPTIYSERGALDVGASRWQTCLLAARSGGWPAPPGVVRGEDLQGMLAALRAALATHSVGSGAAIRDVEALLDGCEGDTLEIG